LFLRRLTLYNYRNIKGLKEFVFSEKNIISGDSGSGLSNFLRGLYWCFTGYEEPECRESDIINYEEAENSLTKFKVYAEAEFLIDDADYILRRTKHYNKSRNIVVTDTFLSKYDTGGHVNILQINDINLKKIGLNIKDFQKNFINGEILNKDNPYISAFKKKLLSKKLQYKEDIKDESTLNALLLIIEDRSASNMPLIIDYPFKNINKSNSEYVLNTLDEKSYQIIITVESKQLELLGDKIRKNIKKFIV